MNYLGGIEKAVYADTPQNRRLNRVGQEYHRGRKKQGGAAPEPNSNSGNAAGKKIIDGGDFHDFCLDDNMMDSPASKKVDEYIEKHHLHQLYQSSIAQMKAFDELPMTHKKRLSAIINGGYKRKKTNSGGGEVMSGSRFSDLVNSDLDWDSSAGRKLTDYLDKHDLMDKLSNGKTQAQDFENLPDKHKKTISKLLSQMKN